MPTTKLQPAVLPTGPLNGAAVEGYDLAVPMSESTLQTTGPYNVAEYWNVKYWDRRYSEGVYASKHFDWYQRYDALKETFNAHIPKHYEILVAGCGKSQVTEEMYYDGYARITNIDYCFMAVERNRSKYAPMKTVKWIQTDARNMPDIAANMFGAVFDKALLDSIMTGERSTSDTTDYLLQVSRVLLPLGKFFLVSHSSSFLRLDLLTAKKFGWKLLEVKTLPWPICGQKWDLTDSKDDNKLHFIYVLQMHAPNENTPPSILEEMKKKGMSEAVEEDAYVAPSPS
jgi:SAM-dependent methyltransferase